MNIEVTYYVKKIREERGLSQRQLAEKCQLSNSTISCIESGKRKPAFEVLLIIAIALGVDIKELYTYR